MRSALMTSVLAIIAILGLLAPAQVTAKEAPELDTEELTAFVERHLDRARTPTAALVIVQGDRVIYSRGFGVDRRSDQPVDADDRFYIGSNTKPITAFATLTLADAGRIDLDAPITRYLRDFRLADGRADEITVRHLLSHRSGLSTVDAFDLRTQEHGVFDHLSLIHDPGTQADYSSLNFVVLGQLIEAASGLEYGEYLERNVFEPLGMQRSLTGRATADAVEVVQGHAYVLGFPVARSEPPYFDHMIPTGYVVSTARDLGRFLSAFFPATLSSPEGVSPAEVHTPVLSASWTEQMLRPVSGKESGVTLGMGASQQHGTTIVAHAGMTPGFSSRLAILPELGLGVALVTSRADGPFFPAHRDLMDGVIRRLVGAETVEPAMRGHWLRLGFVAMALWSVVSLARLARRWWLAGQPKRLTLSRRALVPALLRLVASLVLCVWILRSLAQISLAGMLEFYPDFGVLIVLGVVVATFEAILGAWLKSQAEVVG